MKISNRSLLPASFILFLVLAVSFSCNNPSKTIAGLSVDTLAMADQKMQSYVDEGKLPCIATLVIRDGKVVHRQTIGLANIEEGRALKEDAIFRIYSMSKPITAAALMILYDEGKFKLDDPVSMYVPAFENTKVWVDGKEVDQLQPFTVRNLLTHTAGFCYGWGDSYVDSLYRVAAPGGFDAFQSLKEAVDVIAAIPLKHQPGTIYEYSVSLDVAGYLVEVLSGMPFDEFLKTRLTAPLGMDDTGFEVPEKDFGRLAMVYTMDDSTGKLKPVENMTNGVMKKVKVFSGGGGMVSTIGDYGRFAQMLLNGGELDGVRVLQESTVKLIMSDQKPPNVTYQEGIGYGLGGQVVNETGAYSWSGAASTDFVVDPLHNMAVVAFTQYVPFMGVPYAAEYQKMVQSAIVTPQGSGNPL
jgi:CubicO group peptidase (beta-lactamase class C family)